tara:strand:+ start:148 stop:450 length:303 start_codon:yes stop_codon:yes gene_type:complete
MKNLDNWKKWYSRSKEALISDFADFVKRLKVGDMDLNTYCRYRYFVYQNEEKLVETYIENKNDKGEEFLKTFNDEEVYRLSVFAQVEKQEDDNNSEQGIA